MAPDGFAGIASTMGTAAVPAVTCAMFAGTFGEPFALARALGGGPLYFSVAEWRKAHCLALQEL